MVDMQYANLIFIDKMKCLSGFLCVISLLFSSGFVSCGGSDSKKQESLPAGFGNLDDASKVAYFMERLSPDSVARLICDASLGKVAEVRIDTFAIAAAYAYEHYSDSCLIAFSKEIDGYTSNLPLPEKMRIYFMAGKADPQRMGYQLGLEYVNHIRENSMTVEQIREELEEFRNACAGDSATFRRFVKGFHTVLKIDHGKDLPEDVYEAFVNY